MPKLNRRCQRIKRQLVSQGYVVHFQREVSHNEPIEVNGQEIKVPFTNMGHLWYLLVKRDGQLYYSGRSSQEDFETRIGIYV